ncbi:hypothetical protein AVEN_176673-1, partial [Araneus ventricosus]
MEIEGDKNSVGKKEPIVDVKLSGKPVNQDADMDVKETPEDGFSASSRVKEEQTVVEEEISSPAPVPSAGEDCVDIKPDSSTHLSKNKTIFKPDELHQALMPTLEELNKQDPEWLPFHHFLPVNMNFCLLLFGVLQAVQQAQAAAARQTAPHMVTTAVNDGKGNPVISPPTLGPDLIATQQQMQKPPQVMPSPPGPSVNMPRPTTQALQILQTIKSPTCSSRQWQQALTTLESDPQVSEAYIELRTAPMQQQQMFLNKSDIGPPSQPNVWYKQQQHLIAMQRQQQQQQPNQFPLPPMYALHPWMPMPMNFGHQQRFQNDSFQFQFQQQGPQQILMQPQIKQMASPIHPPISPQQGIFNHPQGPVPSPSQQQLMQRVQS